MMPGSSLSDKLMKPGSRSVSARLMWMNVLVSGTVLVLAVIAFFSYDLISFRQNLIRNIETSAQIVGANSVSALLFDDPQSAATTLEALRNSPDVVNATLVASDGQVFAEYRRNGQTGSADPSLPEMTPGRVDQEWVKGRHVLLAHRIVFQGKTDGTVYIAAELTETGRRARQYLIIALAVLLICMMAGILIGSRVRKMVARPIGALAETARQVSRERDYSVRAEPHTDNGEIAVLIESFNEMLVQIQERDTALRGARDQLETRVQERTAALRAANRELEAFSYTVAHDLRGPLDAVQGMVYILEALDREKRDSDRGEILEQLQQATRNMTLLIDDLLNLSRASTTTMKREPVRLTDLAWQIAGDLNRSDPKRAVEFRIEKVPEIEADGGLMRVVLDNLIRNAWKYTSRHEHACIEFGVVRQRGETIFYVRDDGAGFDPKMNDQLFQPFRRLHSRSEFPGTGIGLATVQRILERHGGRIWAEGSVEKGATFWFTVRSGAAAVA
ncbi:MAG TPA: ATP-binding protein [Acidobacteriaceae bacterium]|jgi:signal transduction histidine kinase|nr:ATP-binding protein [Acidobacteriaceae bacterium]